MDSLFYIYVSFITKMRNSDSDTLPSFP